MDTAPREPSVAERAAKNTVSLSQIHALLAATTHRDPDNILKTTDEGRARATHDMRRSIRIGDNLWSTHRKRWTETPVDVTGIMASARNSSLPRSDFGGDARQRVDTNSKTQEKTNPGAYVCCYYWSGYGDMVEEIDGRSSASQRVSIEVLAQSSQSMHGGAAILFATCSKKTTSI